MNGISVLKMGPERERSLLPHAMWGYSKMMSSINPKGALTRLLSAGALILGFSLQNCEK